MSEQHDDDPVIDNEYAVESENDIGDKEEILLSMMGKWRSDARGGYWCTGSYEVMGPKGWITVQGMTARIEKATEMLKLRYKMSRNG